MVTYGQISPKMMNPRDLAGKAEEEKDPGVFDDWSVLVFILQYVLLLLLLLFSYLRGLFDVWLLNIPATC